MQRVVDFIRGGLGYATRKHQDSDRGRLDYAPFKHPPSTDEDPAHSTTVVGTGTHNDGGLPDGHSSEPICEGGPPSIQGAVPAGGLLHVGTHPRDHEPERDAVDDKLDCLHGVISQFADVATSRIQSIRFRDFSIHTCDIKNEPPLVKDAPPMCFVDPSTDGSSDGEAGRCTVRLPGDTREHVFNARSRTRAQTLNDQSMQDCTSKVGRELESSPWIQHLHNDMLEAIISTLFVSNRVKWARVCTGWFHLQPGDIKVPGDHLFCKEIRWLNYKHCTDGTLVHVDTQLVHFPSPVLDTTLQFVVMVAILIPKETLGFLLTAARIWTRDTQRHVLNSTLDRKESAPIAAARAAVVVASRTQQLPGKSPCMAPLDIHNEIVIQYTHERGCQAHLPFEAHAFHTAVSAATLCALNTEHGSMCISWNFSKMTPTMPLFTVTTSPR